MARPCNGASWGEQREQDFGSTHRVVTRHTPVCGRESWVCFECDLEQSLTVLHYGQKMPRPGDYGRGVFICVTNVRVHNFLHSYAIFRNFLLTAELVPPSDLAHL